MANLKDLVVQGPSRLIGDTQGTKFIVDGGTSTQALMGDGSLATISSATQINNALTDLDERKLDASAYTELWESGTVLNSVVLKGSSGTASGSYSVAEGLSTSATSPSSHAEGNNTLASGHQSHAEGSSTSATSAAAHAEGASTKALGNRSHAEGEATTASGNSSHAEGGYTKADGQFSHAEGQNTTASGGASHVEGNNTNATGTYSHAEGLRTTAAGESAHAEGEWANAKGIASHAEGSGTTTNNLAEHASGYYNVSSSASTDIGHSGNTLFSVGNGTSNSSRHNALEIRQNGDIYIVNKNGQDVRLQDALEVTVDQSIDSGTSASTNAVSTKAVFDYVEEIDYVLTTAVNDLQTNKLDSSTFNTYSGTVNTAINSKASQSDLNTVSGSVSANTSGISELSGQTETIAAALVELNSKIAAVETILSGLNGLKLQVITQSDYDAAVTGGTIDANTLYIING